MRINAKGLYYRRLNELIHQAIDNGSKNIILDNVNGQRYIGGILSAGIKITINGVPGNDLASFMDGTRIVVNANVQDGTANTMNAGKIIVHGDAGDITGHSMRGGKIFIKGDVGYRVGIHMKAYKDLYPVIIAGGCAGDFLGEYMAGGLIIILGLNNNVSKTREHRAIVGNYIGTGMHGGLMYIRGKPKDYQLGKEVRIFELDTQDKARLKKYLEEYCNDFSLNFKQIMKEKCIKLAPYTSRPYGKLYAY